MQPTSTNEHPFIEARCTCESEKEKYSLDELDAMSKAEDKAERAKFSLIANNLVCPKCEKANLKFVPAARDGSRRAYLAAVDVSEHEDWCSFKHPRATKTILSQIAEHPDEASIETRLNGLLSSLDSVTPPEKNPCLIKVDSEGRICDEQTKEGTDGVRTYYIPQWKLSRPLDDTCVDVPQCYYGEANLKWRATPSAPKCHHELFICRDGEDDPSCILRFSDAAYRNLPTAVQKADGVPFKDALAIFVRLSNEYPPKDIKRQDGKTIYTGYVGYFTKIVFRSTPSSQSTEP